MNPKAPLDKLTLIQLYTKYLTNEELKNILYAFDLPVSGTKDKLLELIEKKVLNSISPDDAIEIINNEILKDICRDYDLPVGGNKIDLVDRILDNVLIKKARKKEERSKDNKTSEKKPLSGNNDTQLREWLDAEFDQIEIKDACSRLDLSTKGNKDQLLDRLLESTKNSPKRTLAAWDYYTLKNKAEDLGIPTRRSKKEQIEEFLKAFFGESFIVTESKPIDEKITVSSNPIVNNIIKKSFDQTSFNNLVKMIVSWTPSNSYPHESGYEGELATWLKAKGYDTRQQTGDSLADILVDGVYPIEIKKEPKLGDYDRTVGQIQRHCLAYGSIIVVMCNVKYSDQFDDFGTRVKLALRDYPHIIIKKG
jgi:hypothetical protein